MRKQTKIEIVLARVVNAMILLENIAQDPQVTAAYAQLLEAKRELDEIERT